MNKLLSVSLGWTASVLERWLGLIVLAKKVVDFDFGDMLDSWDESVSGDFPGTSERDL